MLAPENRTFFGFEWGVWYFTSKSILFEWKLSAFIYHGGLLVIYRTGSLVSHYFRSTGIPCSHYIYDRYSSQLRVARDSGFHRLGLDERQFNLAPAHMATFLGCYTLVNFGFISLQKSTLISSQSGNTIRYDYLLMGRPLRGLAFSNPDEIPVVAADCLPNNSFLVTLLFIFIVIFSY